MFDISKPFSIYGLGNVGQKIATKLKKQGYTVQYFIDRRAEKGQHIDGVLCITPDQCKNMNIKQVVLGVFNRDVSPKSLQETLKANGVKIVLSYQEINNFIPGIADSSYWFEPKLDLNFFVKEISSTRALFKDKLSLETFDQIIKFRRTAKINDHIEGIGIEKQYFDVDIPGWLNLESITMLDCGAYDGDTLAAGIKFSAPIKNAYCFEPDEKNFAKLSTYCKSQALIKCCLIPCATWSKTTQLSFQADSGEASHVAEKSETVVQTVALDDFLVDIPFNFIKVDVEGADLDTIKGGMRNINEFRPYIAIGIYHRPKDLWEIPLYLSDQLDNYKYYLRQHGHNCFDTVLYAVPTQ